MEHDTTHLPSPDGVDPAQALPETLAGHPLLDELRAAYTSDKLIVFAGAGIGQAAGLPNWRGLAKRLGERLRQDHAPVEVLAEFDKFLQAHQYINALSAAKLYLGAPTFGVAVERALDDHGREPPDVARAIAALKPRLKAVLTTNLDRFLERALGWPPITNAIGDAAMRREYILKLHGTLTIRDTWIFSREQYDRAIFASPGLQAVFGAIYRSFPILFIGFGLADDNMEQTFGAVRALAGDQPPPHFALLEAPIGPFRRHTLDAAGIRILAYPNQDGSHSEVPAVLRWLASAGQ